MATQPTVNRSTSIAENEKRFKQGEKFEEKKTKGDVFRSKVKKAIKETDFRESKDRNKKLKRLDVSGPEKKGKGRIIGGEFYPAMAKGGRAGFKSGSKGCKLAMKGKGRAYGKNS